MKEELHVLHLKRLSLGDVPLFLYDDNPLFLSEIFSECSSEDEDICTKLYVLNPFVRLIAVWYCIIIGIIIFIPLMMWSLSFYLGLDHLIFTTLYPFSLLGR